MNEDAKIRRVPNAFMIFVKEKNQDLLKKCSAEEKASRGAYLGRKWRSMPVEEKQVYFEKYKALKALESDNIGLHFKFHSSLKLESTVKKLFYAKIFFLAS